MNILKWTVSVIVQVRRVDYDPLQTTLPTILHWHGEPAPKVIIWLTSAVRRLLGGVGSGEFTTISEEGSEAYALLRRDAERNEHLIVRPTI